MGRFDDTRILHRKHRIAWDCFMDACFYNEVRLRGFALLFLWGVYWQGIMLAWAFLEDGGVAYILANGNRITYKVRNITVL
jgi:hypothetical protein